jgi:hypothetical protein
MQVTPDGEHMALVTNSNLTSYDSHWWREMYTYEPRTGRLTCVSCRPDAKPPTNDVHASQNGLFQTENGRVFFSTPDPLVVQDTNEAIDTYEWTEGKAQLISSGIGPSLGNGYGFQGVLNKAGVVSVSANGTDVYFATIETLVTQDHNGSQIKVYDARIGGGFPADVPAPNCVAADECHGPSSAAPVLPPDRTSAELTPPQAKKKAAKHKKKHKHKHKKKKAKKKNAKGGAKKQHADRKRGGGNRG